MNLHNELTILAAKNMPTATIIDGVIRDLQEMKDDPDDKDKQDHAMIGIGILITKIQIQEKGESFTHDAATQAEVAASFLKNRGGVKQS